MAQQFPCDIDGICLTCQTHPREEEKLQCVKCVTFWHLPCRSVDLPTTLDDTMNWICSDCLNMERSCVPFTWQVHDTVNADPMDAMLVSEKGNNTNSAEINMSLSNILTRDLQCFVCYGLYERPVTTPCGHTCCFKCFHKWMREGNKTCAICRHNIPKKISVNVALETVVRAVKDEYEKNRGVLVGDTWSYRAMCRKWDVPDTNGHLNHGAQSLILGGDSADDDYGEWFLYSLSDAEDLDGNKRTNKKQSSDQEFESYNIALRVSCLKGYPVRVFRSSKDKRSSYAPRSGYRYDGIYRVEKYWQLTGQQGFLVCRYMFVRCDNVGAPWKISDVRGDIPRPLPDVPELEKAYVVYKRIETPFWDYDDQDSSWKWVKPQPPNKPEERSGESKPNSRKRKFHHQKIMKKLKKGFSCLICKNIMGTPVTTPCGHSFCKACLEGVFAGQTLVRERNMNGIKLRPKKNIMKCPSCYTNIAEYLHLLQVDVDLTKSIESMKANELGEEK